MEKTTFTTETLKELKLISNTNGRPASTLTDTLWQKEFAIRKLFLIPRKNTNRLLGGKYSKECGLVNSGSNDSYYGQTNWQEYCAYINDVLLNIRAGQIDYCYFIYQIMDITKFHYDDLRTRYRDGYWEIWLEREV